MVPEEGQEDDQMAGASPLCGQVEAARLFNLEASRDTFYEPSPYSKGTYRKDDGESMRECTEKMSSEALFLEVFKTRLGEALSNLI